jgi:hypothetical protein
MINSSNLLSQLEQLLRMKKSKKFYAERLGISEAEVEELMSELKNKPGDEESIPYQTRVNVDSGSLESTIEVSFEPKDDLEIAKLHKINLDKYRITNYWSKLKSNGKFTSSVLATIRKPDDYGVEDFQKFLETYQPVYDAPPKKEEHFEYMDAEISIADFHLAKKTLEGEDMATKESHFMDTLAALVDRMTSCFKLHKIVFPISNDFFHTDNYQNTTTNGTPQDVLVGYDKEYEVGFDLLVKAIAFLRQHCNVLEVILVQGNHDRTKSFYLAHGLEVFFSKDVHIKFKREHGSTKWTCLGDTFIGYHHGNCKIDELPLLFATGNGSEMFGKCKYREVHTGDKHHYMAKEIKGVRIQQMPSLSGTDRWHADNNYVHNIRAGLALVYHPIFGKIAEFEERI